jgi:uncharacterized protein
MTYRDIKASVAPVLARQGVLRASIFGSCARNESGPRSDIDFLVELEEGRSLLDLVALRLELQKRLRRKVDVVTFASLHPLLRKRVLAEQRPVYEKRA